LSGHDSLADIPVEQDHLFVNRPPRPE
jgi:hypothetical protein